MIGCIGKVTSADPIQRLNYGVVFKEHADLHLAQEHWLHTFEIPIPEHVQFPTMEVCQHSNNTCLIINQIMAQINTVRAETSVRLSSLVDTVYQLIPETKIEKGRGKRSLLPFIGQFSKSLFGTATTDDVNVLAKHINALTKKTLKIVDALQQHGAHLSSYMTATNKHMDYLMKGIKANENEIKIIRNRVKSGILKLQETFGDMSNFVTSVIEQAEHLNHKFDEFKLGIVNLAEGKLSPAIIPPSSLHDVMNNIHSILQAKYSKFHLTYDSVNDVYASNKFLYARQNHSLFVTIKFPITPQQKPLKLFKVYSYPVPINSTSSHGTQLLDLPAYFAVTFDQQFYSVLDNGEIAECTGHKHLYCSGNKALLPVTTETCILSLFINSKEKTNKLCNFRFVQNVINPGAYEIEKGSILIYRTPLLSLECSSDHKMIKGCDFCIVRIPCQCTLLTNNVMLLPRLMSCHNNTNNVTVVHHFNLALIQKFFDDSHYRQLFADTNFAKPFNLTIPNFSLYKHQMHDIIVADKESHLNLDKMVEAAKQDTMSFQSLTEPLLDGLIDVNSNWPDTNAVMIFVTMGISILLSITVAWMFFKMRKMAMTILVLQQAQCIKSLSTEVPSLLYTAASKQAQSAIVQIDFDLSWEHAIFLLGVINLVFIIFYNCKQTLCRNHSVIQLEVTNGEFCVLVPVITLPMCPSYCQIAVPSDISALQLTGPWYNKSLSLAWSKFSLTNLVNRKSLVIPTKLHITAIQYFKLRRILSKPFFVYLHVEHNGFLKAIYGDQIGANCSFDK